MPQRDSSAAGARSPGGGAPDAPGFDVRRLTLDQVATLARLVELAVDRGDLAASSEPDGRFFAEQARFEPHTFAFAWAGTEAIGFVSPEMKALVVEPAYRRRGIGRRLVEAGLAIELERRRTDFLLGRMPDDAVASAFLASCGFGYHSTLWDLALPPGFGVVPPVWPDGLVARPYDHARDIEGWVELFNAAFADHATPLRLDARQLEFVDDPDFEDADTLLVEDRSARDAPLVGFCSTSPRRPGGAVAPVGEIWTIGVRPDAQGRGLGRQLLRWGVERLRSIGVREVRLSVNGRNERALSLYEREGFERIATRERWSRPAFGGASAAGEAAQA